MSWTSHSFHMLKDLQPFAAALVAFSGVSVTVILQRKIAERQSKVALSIADKSQKTKERENEVDVLKRRIACAVEIEMAITRLKNSVSTMLIVANEIINQAKSKNIVRLNEAAAPRAMRLLFIGSKFMDENLSFRDVPQNLSDLPIAYMRTYYVIRSSISMVDVLLNLPTKDGGEISDIPLETIVNIRDALIEIEKAATTNEKRFRDYAEIVDLELANI